MSGLPAKPTLRLCVVQLDGIPRARNADGLWVPAEPLADSIRISHSDDHLQEVSAARLFAGDVPDAYREIQDLATQATSSRVSEVLTFLAEHTTDVVVFPESLMPPSCLPALVEFSNGRAVVAGLGYVRNQSEAEYLAAIADRDVSADILRNRNVSVLVENGRVHVVTKRSMSTDEIADEGDGPLVRSLTIRGRQIRLAVAVCMDHLQWEHTAREQKADIVCIPAYSQTVRPFTPDAPRDHVRLLANCATHGGSQIMIPALSNPLASDLGVRPIAAGYEAVIIVEYDSYPHKPTSLRRPENRLVLRSEIIERSSVSATAVTAIRAFNAELEPVAADPLLRANVVSWLEKVSEDSPLGEALRVYESSLAQEFDDHHLRTLADTHLTVEAGGRREAVRGRQARFVVERLQRLKESGVKKPMGRAIDTYSELVEQFSIAIGTAEALRAPQLGDAMRHGDDLTAPQADDRPRTTAPDGVEHAGRSVLRFTLTTGRDGTRSEEWEIFDRQLAREVIKVRLHENGDEQGIRDDS